MIQQEWINYKIKVRERLRMFAMNILTLSEMFPDTIRTKVINYQLTKSGTPAYANYRAALRGRSGGEFFSKLSISIEEIDESEMWLELTITSKIIENELDLHNESMELVKVLSNMRKNHQKKSNQSNQSHQS